jgi:hypothetical protein
MSAEYGLSSEFQFAPASLRQHKSGATFITSDAACREWISHTRGVVIGEHIKARRLIMAHGVAFEDVVRGPSELISMRKQA